jgi:secreted trypsin-like serine protease
MIAPDLQLPSGRVQRAASAAFGRRPIHRGVRVGCKVTARPRASCAAVTLVATDRPSSQQLSLIDPRKLGDTAGFGVCNGDSGGPVFDEQDQALVGIVSWSARTDGEPACCFVSGVITLARSRYWILETAARLGSPLEP